MGSGRVSPSTDMGRHLCDHYLATLRALFLASFRMRPPLPFAALVFTLALGLTIFLPLALATYQIAQQSGFLLGWIAQRA